MEKRMRISGATIAKADILPAAALRLLAAILWRQQRGMPITIGGLCKDLGHASKNAITGPLRRLCAAGLVAQERFRGRTIRARCSMTLYKRAK